MELRLGLEASREGEVRAGAQAAAGGGAHPAWEKHGPQATPQCHPAPPGPRTQPAELRGSGHHTPLPCPASSFGFSAEVTKEGVPRWHPQPIPQPHSQGSPSWGGSTSPKARKLPLVSWGAGVCPIQGLAQAGVLGRPPCMPRDVPCKPELSCLGAHPGDVCGEVTRGPVGCVPVSVSSLDAQSAAGWMWSWAVPAGRVEGSPVPRGLRYELRRLVQELPQP